MISQQYKWYKPPLWPKLCLASSCSKEANTIKLPNRRTPPTPHEMKRGMLVTEIIRTEFTMGCTRNFPKQNCTSAGCNLPNRTEKKNGKTLEPSYVEMNAKSYSLFSFQISSSIVLNFFSYL